MSNIQLATVQFHGHALTVITNAAGEHLVAMKPICENIGLDWEAQRKRIARHEVLQSVTSMMEATAADGKNYEYTCLPLDYLNGWLFGVDTTRVKPEIRQRLIQYQRECFHVLAAYWQQGEVVNPPAGSSDSVIYTTISTDGLTVLSNLVAGKVNHLTRQNQRRATMKLWAQVQAAFNVRSVEDLPADKLSEARTFIAAYVLEGEYLGKEDAPKKPEPTPEPPQPQGITLTNEDFYNFCLLMLRFRMLHRIFELHLFQSLQQLCSKIFDPLADNFYVANNAATALEKRFRQQIEAVEHLLKANK